MGTVEAQKPEPFEGFNASQVGDYRLNHSYFEKEMRTPYVVMKRSAMSDHSRYNILANELVRRLSNMRKEDTSHEEKEGVIEHMIKQCKTSGYSRHETREAIVCGIKGWKRKCMRRERDGVEFYRSGRSTLGTRTKKKLTEKSSWYKKKRKRDEEENEDENHANREHEKESPTKKKRMNDWKETMKETFEGLKAKHQEREKSGGSGEAGEEEEEAHLPDLLPADMMSKSAVAVIVVPCTRGAELAKRIRDYEMMAKVQTGWFLNVVEKGVTP